MKQLLPISVTLAITRSECRRMIVLAQNADERAVEFWSASQSASFQGRGGVVRDDGEAGISSRNLRAPSRTWTVRGDAASRLATRKSCYSRLYGAMRRNGTQ